MEVVANGPLEDDRLLRDQSDARPEDERVVSGEGEAVVSDVLRPGYTLKGRVIRPAGVKVTRK